LDDALYRDRTLVRIPAMHARLFVVPSDEFPSYYQASRPILQEGLAGYLDDLLADAGGAAGLPLPGIAGLVPRILEILSARGPSTVQELATLLPALDAPLVRGNGNGASSRLGERLIPAMCVQGLLVRAQTRGSWRSDLFSYAPTTSWLPGLRLDEIDPDEALRRVILAHVAAFGPVNIGDVYQWLGGARRQQVAAALMRLGERLAHVQIVGSSRDYVMLREHVDAMMAYRPTARAVALLPPKDSYVMAYGDTSRFLDEAYRERVFDRAGEAHGTVWLDGSIVGLWSHQLREERISVRLFAALDPEALELLHGEARRVCRFLEFESSDVVVGLDDDMDDDQATIALPSMAVDDGSIAVDGTTAPR